MRYSIWAILLLAALSAGLLGCSTSQAPVAAPVAATATLPPAPQATVAAEATPLPATKAPVTAVAEAVASEKPEMTPPAEAKRAVQLAKEDLAQNEGITVDAIRLVSVESVQWSDTSLGCPEPDMVYAQVITPGYLVKLEAKGQEYEYHTDEGRFVVLCQPGD